MIAMSRGFTVGLVLAGAAVWFAGPAAAQLTEGSYTWTTTGGSGPTGVHSQWTLTSCGQDCITVRFSNGVTTDLHLQGNTWAGPNPNNQQCSYTIDNNSIAGRNSCADGTYEFQLTKNS